MRKNAIIVGAGSYVIGDSLGDGVILPSLLYLQKTSVIERIFIAVRTARGNVFTEKLNKYQKLLNTSYTPEIFIYRDLSDLRDIDFKNSIAFISVPDKFHFDICSFFLKNRVPVWIVKPLTGDYQRSKSLCTLAETNKTELWVDYHKRFDPSNLKIKEAIDQAKYGNLLMYSVQYSQPASLPLNDLRSWSKEVDVLQYIGCHYIDQVFFYFPKASVKKVSCQGIEGELHKKGGPRYDIIHCIVDFEITDSNFFRLDLNVSWGDPKYSPAKSHQRVELQFERGRIIADQKNRGFEIWSNEHFEQVNPNFFQLFNNHIDENLVPKGYGFDSINGFLKFISSKGNILSHNSKLLPWGHIAVNTDFVLKLAKESLSNEGLWVKNL